jgi:hypothetical protein
LLNPKEKNYCNIIKNDEIKLTSDGISLPWNTVLTNRIERLSQLTVKNSKSEQKLEFFSSPFFSYNSNRREE